MATPELARAIQASAQRLGINPSDLGTVISYETAGTFDPWKAGPTTQWGQHRGLIQWGEPQRAKYGVTQNMPVDAQMQAVERYLTDAGVQPGMGILDVYSAINAGRVGRYNASDANNGGAPGTVADKVNTQMAGHRAKAEALLGLAGGAMPAGSAAPVAQASSAPSAAPIGLLSQSDPAAEALQSQEYEKQIMGLLAQANAQPEQQQQAQMPEMGLLSAPMRAPQFQMKTQARRRA